MSTIARRRVVTNPALTGRPGGAPASTQPAPKRAVRKVQLGSGAAAAAKRPARVSLATKAGRLAKAAAAWAKAGFPVTERQARLIRRAVCEGCDLWRPAGNGGFGECAHEGCGCTKVKRWLATERCPLGRWPELTVTTLVGRAGQAWRKATRKLLRRP